MTVEQRFGAALNLNLHYHCLVPDGVFAREDDGELQFHRVRPHRADIEGLVERIAERCERWLVAQGVDDEAPDPDDAQALLIAASVEGRVAAGPRAGERARRTGVGPSGEEPTQGVSYAGYGLHAGTWVSADDRTGLAKLARYLLRPPLAKGRLEELPDGHVRWHLRRAWSDGTTGFVFSPSELVQRLAAFVVRPRVHTIHFHGVFAPRSGWRSEVVVDPATARKHREALATRRAEEALVRRRRRRLRRRSRWSSHCPWSALLEQIFGQAGLRCPKCGQPMALRTVVIGRPATTRVLAGLARSARGPPVPAILP